VWHADVLLATRPQKVVVTCFGQEWPLRLDCAAGWIGAIGFDLVGLSGVLPGGIEEEDVERMWAAIPADPVVAERRWRNSARVAVSRGSGRDWWWTVNLTRRCLQSWPYINGLLLLQGVDAEAMRFPSWLDAAYMLLWQRGDEEHRQALDLELSIPPVGVSSAQAPVAAKNMLSAFAAD
jgi:hypothetical protein